MNIGINKKTLYTCVYLGLFLTFMLGFSYIQSTSNFETNINVDKFAENIDTVNGNSLLDTMKHLSTPDDIKSKFVSKKIEYEDFSSESNGQGLYSMANTLATENPIMYYRGNVNNNNIVFANKCWKVLRTTSTGGIRLLYNGEYTNDNKCNNTGENASIGNSKFSNLSSLGEISYVNGYKYSIQSGANDTESKFYFGHDVTYANGQYTLVDTKQASGKWATDNENILGYYKYTCKATKATNKCSQVYYYVWGDDSRYKYILLSDGEKIENAFQKSLTFNSDSVAKTNVETWYENSNLGTYSSKIMDERYCADRRLDPLAGWSINESSKVGITLFYKRHSIMDDIYPMFECVDEDSYTVSSDNGNGLNRYPVGLLNVDDALLAGVSEAEDGTVNNSYIYSGVEYWTMQPNHMNNSGFAHETTIAGTGFEALNVENQAALRPVITIVNNVRYNAGDGTALNPYMIMN